MEVKVLVAQSLPTLWDPTDGRLPGCSVHGINQAGILEWVAISFFRGILPASQADSLLPELPRKLLDVMEHNESSSQFPVGKTQRALTAWPDLCNLPSCSSAQVSSVRVLGVVTPPGLCSHLTICLGCPLSRGSLPML